MTHSESDDIMFFSAPYPRYIAELGLFAFLAFCGISLNSQTLIALGILVLSHCLPSLVLATLRQREKPSGNGMATLYTNSFCNFREKEAVTLISSSLMIGVAIGLLFLSLQIISFVPLSNDLKTMILAIAFIGLEFMLYSVAHIRSKSTKMKKPLKSRVIRILVASMIIVIAYIDHQLLQCGLDMLIGFSVLSYVLYTSGILLYESATNFIRYTPTGLEIGNVKAHILKMPGVLAVNKAYFRRVNENEHELGVHLSLARFLLNNSALLKHKMKEEIQRKLGISSVTIELEWEDLQPSHSDSKVIVLGHDK